MGRARKKKDPYYEWLDNISGEASKKEAYRRWLEAISSGELTDEQVGEIDEAFPPASGRRQEGLTSRGNRLDDATVTRGAATTSTATRETAWVSDDFDQATTETRREQTPEQEQYRARLYEVTAVSAEVLAGRVRRCIDQAAGCSNRCTSRPRGDRPTDDGDEGFTEDVRCQGAFRRVGPRDRGGTTRIRARTFRGDRRGPAA